MPCAQTIGKQFGKSEVMVNKCLGCPEERAISFPGLIMENFTEKVLSRWMLGHKNDKREDICEDMGMYEGTAVSQGAEDLG